MRKVWTVCRTCYIDWLFRQQTLMLCPILIFLYLSVIGPMQYYADVFGTPLNLFEPFLCMLNSVYAVPLLPLSYLFLFAGYPKLTPGSVFQLCRTGKRTWFLGQCLFLLLSGTPFKWLIPAAHAVFSGHFDGVLNKVYMPVGCSFVYDGVLLASLFAAGMYAVRRCSVLTVIRSDGEKP